MAAADRPGGRGPARLRPLVGLGAEARPGLLIRILCLALVCRARMRLSPARLRRELSRPGRGRPGAAVDAALLARHVDAVLIAARPLVPSGCLARALVLHRLLRGSGLGVEVVFGVREVGGRYLGHCWLAQDGEPLLEARDPRGAFVTVLRMP